jgi:hypothetical protein
MIVETAVDALRSGGVGAPAVIFQVNFGGRSVPHLSVKKKKALPGTCTFLTEQQTVTL